MRLRSSTVPSGRRAGVLLVAVATALAGLALAAPAASAAPRPSSSVPAGLISFVSSVDGVDQVFTMRADGSARTQVTFNKTGTKKCDPMLNAGATEVTYASNDGRMYVHRLDGTLEATDIAPAVALGKRGGGRRPTFSADGNTVVFHFTVDADAEAPVYDLWTTSRQADGTWSPAERITHLTPGQWALHPRYSQAAGSSTWLAYSFRPAPTAAYELYVVDLASTAPATATVGSPIGERVPQTTGGLLATWSARGDKLAFVKSCAGAVEYLNVSTSSGRFEVTGGPIAVAQSGGCGLSWSRTDNNHLVYSDYSRIYVKDVSSTRKAASLGTGVMPSW